MPLIAVYYAEPALALRATQLAESLALPCIPQDDKTYTYLLVVTEERLSIRAPDRRSEIVVDFVEDGTRHWLSQGFGKRSPLAKAIGVKNHSTSVLDLSAGFGQDAFMLASLNLNMTLLERSPIMHALLADGLRRAAATTLAPIANCIKLIHTDALTYLRALKQNLPDVIYFDPMYSPRKKSALVKYKMRVLKDLVGENDDATEVLAYARSLPLSRVVVKRAIKAPPLSEDVDFCIKAERIRFDIYLN